MKNMGNELFFLIDSKAIFNTGKYLLQKKSFW